MINDNDKKLLTECGREYLLDVVFDSNVLKQKLTFKEHVHLCSQVKKLTYEEVITLLVTEDIRDFESKFSKFLKYSIAAIAAGVVAGPGALLAAPAVAMFILYLYRKATDTCVRSCFAKMPLSKQRKICKYECQLNAAKKMADDIRNNISKCSQYQHSEKCEKKLEKEYIKWAKRVQMLIVRLNKAKVDAEEKIRKQRQKELTKRAKTLRASLELPKDQIVKLVSENKVIRDNFSFRDHLKLYQVCQYIKEDDGVAPIKLDPKKEKMVRTVMYLGLWAVPVPFFNDLINYIVKKYSFGCASKCAAQGKLPKNVCYLQCSYLGAQYAVKTLNSQLAKCNKANNPSKCKKKIYNMLEDWKQREVERKIKFESGLRAALSKAKARNAKAAQKGL